MINDQYKAEALAVLRKGRALIDNRWAQGALKLRPSSSWAVTLGEGQDPFAYAYCALGGCREAAIRLDLPSGFAVELLRQALEQTTVKTTAVAAWNDRRGRKKEDVVNLYDSAIEMVESL